MATQETTKLTTKQAAEQVLRAARTPMTVTQITAHLPRCTRDRK